MKNGKKVERQPYGKVKWASVVVRMDRKTRDQINRVAKRQGKSVSLWARRLLERAL